VEICDVKTGFNHEILIERVFEQDFKKITKSKYYFNWQTEKKNQVYCKLPQIGLLKSRIYN
jgi:hypothetical protein